MTLELLKGEEPKTLRWSQELISAKILERPNRYVARVALPTGIEARAHVPVGGRIGGLTLDGLPCLLSGPYGGRSTDYTVEAIGSHYDRSHSDFQWIYIDQTAANRHFKSAAAACELDGIFGSSSAISEVKGEVKLEAKRIDFYLPDGPQDPPLWLELKTPLISLDTVLDPTIPLKVFPSAAPSQRMPQQFEALARRKALGDRVAFLGVFGYKPSSVSSPEARFLANLNLDGLVDKGVALGMEFWQLQWRMDENSLEVESLQRLFCD